MGGKTTLKIGGKTDKSKTGAKTAKMKKHARKLPSLSFILKDLMFYSYKLDRTHLQPITENRHEIVSIAFHSW